MHRVRKGLPRQLLQEIGIVPGKPANEYTADELDYFRSFGIEDPSKVRVSRGRAPDGRDGRARSIAALALAQPRLSRKICTDDDRRLARHRTHAEAYRLVARVLGIRGAGAEREVRRLIRRVLPPGVYLVRGGWRPVWTAEDAKRIAQAKEIAARARDHIDAQAAKGIDVSAAEAVQHELAQIGSESRAALSRPFSVCKKIMFPSLKAPGRLR